MKNPIIQDEKAVAQRRRIINTTFGDLVVAVTDEVKPYIGDPSCRYAVVLQILSDLLPAGSHTFRTRRWQALIASPWRLRSRIRHRGSID